MNIMKPILVSGIQPSGKLHIGNYLGALKNFVDLQNSGKYQCYFFIADLHALTENPDPKDLRRNIIDLAADFFAAGLDPKKSVIFQQSQISAHPELNWILDTIAPMGELMRMTQFKDKARLSGIKAELDKNMSDTTALKIRDEIEELQLDFTNVGLFGYPVLMAADIILYDAAFVPVGDDQDQHLELTRSLARKFNTRFGKTFIEPKGLHTPTPRVMSLKHPEKKMSKSQPEGCLFLGDEPEVIKEKLKRAVTDSGSEIKFDPANKAAISNLLQIYSGVSGKSIESLEKQFTGQTYSAFKSALGEEVANYFADFRKKKKMFGAKQKDLKAKLASGSKKANDAASKKLKAVKQNIGLTI